jgi:hypothetical protein
VSRVIGRGAIVAGWVGVGMALTIGISFLLVIPVGDVALSLFAPLAGLLIGYYANQRSDRRGGPWPRLLANGLYAGLLTGLGFALFALLVKGLFFVADDGYRDASAGGRIACSQGADCVYRRYVAAGHDQELRAAGVTDAASFSAYYWGQGIATDGSFIALSLGGAAAGALVYGITNRRRPSPATAGTVGAG